MEPRESTDDSSAGDDASANSAVQVAVRVRPLSAGESAQGSEPCVTVLGDRSVLVGGLNGKQFDFDAAFAPQIDQQKMYSTLMAPLVDRFFDGYNATVFAYGQTGSGKTFTMGNEFKLSVADADRGIIPRTMDEIFRRIDGASSDTKFTLKLSYLEILNEEIRDLLASLSLLPSSSSFSSSSSSSSLAVREDSKRGVVVHGLTEHVVADLAQVASLLHAGAMTRATASTTMNAQSSRSHAICTLLMEQHNPLGQITFAKFHLVDLAGSERAKKTHAEGARFKEGVNINRGLLSLGNVINALADKSAHVPYRDSKLTRLLQDSLGGNSKTLMVACVSPADVNFEETCSTLRYAARARNITNTAVVNQSLSAETQVAVLKQQLEKLQLQLLQQSTQSVQSTAMTTSQAVAAPFQVDVLEKEIARWRSIAKTREEELQLVMSAKNKWKKIADELVNKKPPQTSAMARPGSLGRASLGLASAVSVTNCCSPKSKALLQDAIEFDKSVQVAVIPATPVKHEPHAAEKEDTTQEDAPAWTTDLDSLEDVIKEKEKIVLALTQATSRSHDGSVGPLAALSTEYEAKIRALEQQIERLTQEKQRLALSTNNGESPQRNLQTQLLLVQGRLEVARHAEKECKRLTTLWKSGTLKISTLEREIVDMKQQKVTLQRQLREESEAHRREKREQSLKIIQLKRQEQRKQFELQKLSTLHAKQNGVLKRKTEEVAAANKKMRTMMQTQQQAQQMRMQSFKGRAPLSTGRNTAGPLSHETTDRKCGEASEMETITKALNDALEVQSTIIGAKNAIQVEIEDRKRLALEIAQLESSDDKAEASLAKLEELTASLREKNSDIRMLQQKLASVEKGTSLPAVLFPAKVSTCHQLIHQLMETLIESRSTVLELDSCKRDLEGAEQQLADQAQHHDDVVAAYKKRLHELGEFDPVVVAPSSKTSTAEELESVKKELEKVRAELELARSTLTVVAQVTAPLKPPAAKKKKKPSEPLETVELVDILSSSDDDEDDEEDDDSDYVEDENVSRKRKKPSSATTPRVRQPLKPRVSFAPSALNLSNPMDEIDFLLSKPSALSGNICCSCSGKCATKSCACRAEKQMCGAECSCKEAKCLNRDGDASLKKAKQNARPEDKENEVQSIFDAVNKENVVPEPPPPASRSLQQNETMTKLSTTTKLKTLWNGGSTHKINAPTRTPTSAAIARFF